MRAFSLLLVLLAALVIPEAYAQPVILSTPGLQCGGTGGICASAAITTAVCADAPWVGWQCGAGMLCRRQSMWVHPGSFALSPTLAPVMQTSASAHHQAPVSPVVGSIWLCIQLPPPSPSAPPLPPRPPTPPPQPPSACPANGGASAQLIDSATPSSACSITVRQGPCPSRSSQTTAMNLVFSDEFAATARNLSGVARDPVWTAHDQHFADTQDQAAYKPDAVSLRACGGAEGCQTPGVLAIRATAQSSPVPDSFQAAAAGPTRVTGLGFRSGMVSSWNKLCFTGGYLEVRAKLPGNPQVG
ncbi:uncharacterized protein HaLaN_23018, partial [Haematococcus lacustris]